MVVRGRGATRRGGSVAYTTSIEPADDGSTPADLTDVVAQAQSAAGSLDSSSLDSAFSAVIAANPGAGVAAPVVGAVETPVIHVDTPPAAASSDPGLSAGAVIGIIVGVGAVVVIGVVIAYFVMQPKSVAVPMDPSLSAVEGKVSYSDLDPESKGRLGDDGPEMDNNVSGRI